jgi:alkanesulfonate monooxygenase
VIVQAGASDDGRQLAAETAEVVFTAHHVVDTARAFYADVKGRMEACSRARDSLKILPGLSVTVAPTQAEADAKFRTLQDLLHPELGVALLSRRIGFDLTGYPLDEPLPDLPENAVVSSRSEMIKGWAEGGRPTLRELYTKFAAARGHFSLVGTPNQVVDAMEEWFTTGACDGFNILPQYYPDGLTDFVDLVVPELQRRGIFRTAYEGPTLRDVLGLPKPVSRYA